jgi:hypothetical protein
MSVYSIPQKLDQEIKTTLLKLQQMAQQSSGGSLCGYGTDAKAREHFVAVAVQRHLDALKKSGYKLS